MIPPTVSGPDMADDVRFDWVFGYGSLVFRPAFPYEEAVLGRLDGYVRRFWQGSTDHRGIPGAPGRVATLVPEARSFVFGKAYRIADSERDAILDGLDHREKGGYSRSIEPIHLPGRTVDALVYWASEDNPEFLGPAPLEAMATQIAHRQGPSGANADYVFRLKAALDELGVPDAQLDRLVAAVRAAVTRRDFDL